MQGWLGCFPSRRQPRRSFNSRASYQFLHVSIATYSNPVYPARAAKRSARRTGCAGVSLADDLNASAGVLAFVPQLRFEHAPAAVEHGLCHPCLHQLQAAHISNDDILVLIHNLSRKLMQRILTPIRCFPMQALCLPLVPTALRPRQLLCDALRPAAGLESLAVTRHGDVLEAKVNANRLRRRGGLLAGDLHR